MTSMQRTAIANHCRLACETMRPRFHRLDSQLSVILTVNTGWE